MIVGLEHPAEDREGGKVLPPADTELKDVALDVNDLVIQVLQEEKPAEVLAGEKEPKILE